MPTSLTALRFAVALLAVGVTVVLAARKLVDDYEFGKPEASRNYEHSAYVQALEELALVDPDSKSAEDADAQLANIRIAEAFEFLRRHAAFVA